MKYSRQRELIFNTVLDNCIHPTAETVYGMLKKDYPNLSLGTVYRNLQVLSEMGFIKRLSFNNKPDRYDGNTEPHYHGVCERCGEVVDMFVNYMSNIDSIAEKSTGLKVLSHNITFNVICPMCLGKEA